jgi:hypothetical protein
VEEAGEASGVTNTFRQVGLSLGAAIIGSVLLTSVVGDLQGAVGASAQIPAAAKPQIELRLRQQSSGLVFSAGGVFDQLPPATRTEMLAARRLATASGNRKALLCGAAFILLGLLFSTRLPLRPQEHGKPGEGWKRD